MGLIDRFEDEYVDLSSRRATAREVLELTLGSVLFVLLAAGLTNYLLGRSAALVVAIVLTATFTITIVSQTYWSLTGRDDYTESDAGSDSNADSRSKLERE